METFIIMNRWTLEVAVCCYLGFFQPQIERIQVLDLYKSYKANMERIKAVIPQGMQVERMLFHGTSEDTCDKINRHGFNRSYSGKNGENPESVNSTNLCLLSFFPKELWLFRTVNTIKIQFIKHNNKIVTLVYKHSLFWMLRINVHLWGVHSSESCEVREQSEESFLKRYYEFIAKIFGGGVQWLFWFTAELCNLLRAFRKNSSNVTVT